MKYLLFLVLGIILVSVAFISFNFGSKYKIQLTPKFIEPSIVPSVSPTPTPKSTKTITGGGILSFNKYSIEVSSDWTVKKEGAPAGEIELERLIFTNGEYKITIYQAATGGAMCLYPGDADVEGPSSRYTTFVDLTTATGQKLRRGGTGSGGFTVCEKQGTNPWGQPTGFGHISIGVPTSPSAAMLSEIDLILSSFKKL